MNRVYFLIIKVLLKINKKKKEKLILINLENKMVKNIMVQ
jgi:hypothetical protein